MKKVVIVFIIFMVALTGYITVKHDLQIKSEAKSAIIDLCANHDSINKAQIKHAIETFENAKSNIRFLNTDREEKARSIVEHEKFCIELSEDGLKMAEDLLKKENGEVANEYNKKIVDERILELSNAKKALSEKMKVVLGAYK